MDLKKIVMNLRTSHVLRGNYPVVVSFPPNNGHIAQNKNAYYVMTLTHEKNLHFYGLTKYLHKFNPRDEFEIKLNEFEKYSFQILNKNLKMIKLINGKDYLPMVFFAGTKTSYEGENNIAYLCKEFEKMGIPETNILIEKDKMLSEGNDGSKKA